MTNNIPHIIFEQFLQILLELAESKCVLDECDFQYQVKELVKHRLLDIAYTVKDQCCRPRTIIITLDITSICLRDLVCCKWIEYLTKKAKEFLHDICAKKIVVVKENLKPCRVEPPRWEPFPCKTVTTIVRKVVPVIEDDCEVIIEEEDICVPVCPRVKCKPQKKVLIKYETEEPWKCGDYTVLVREDKKKHDWGNYKGSYDYNHHVWNKKCECKTKACKPCCK